MKVGTFLNFVLREVPKFPLSNEVEDLVHVFRLYFCNVKVRSLKNDEFISLINDLKLYKKLWVDRNSFGLDTENFFNKRLKSFGWGAVTSSYLCRIASFTNLEFIECQKEVLGLGLSFLSTSRLYNRTSFKLKKVAESLKTIEEYSKFLEIFDLIKPLIKKNDLNEIETLLLKYKHKETTTVQHQTSLPDILSGIEKTLGELTSEYSQTQVKNEFLLPDGTQMGLLFYNLKSQTCGFLLENSLFPVRTASALLVHCIDFRTGEMTVVKSVVMISNEGTNLSVKSYVREVRDSQSDAAGVLHK